MFANFEFSNLQTYSINNKHVHVVDEHNFVLPLWANFSISNNKQYSLVTLDFHTDTKPAFNRYACLQKKGEMFNVWNEFRKSYIKDINQKDINTVIEATKNLANDEHIYAALDLGYILDAHVIHVDDNNYQDHYIFYYLTKNFFDLIPKELCVAPYGRKYEGLVEYRLNRLEDAYINDTKFRIPTNPFILDIDLDYFPTRESLNPIKREYIKELVSKAQLITVARESSYFQENCEQLGFNLQEAESLLLKLIETLNT